jgi:hypothetical protein
MKAIFLNPEDILTLGNLDVSINNLKEVALKTNATLILPYAIKIPKELLYICFKYNIPYDINLNCAEPNRYTTSKETEIIDYIHIHKITNYIILDSFFGYYHLLLDYVITCYTPDGICDKISNEIINFLNNT